MVIEIAAAVAAAVVSSYLKPWADQALSLAQTKISKLYGVKEDLERLWDNLLSHDRVLEDAEEKQRTDKAIERWLEKFKDVAYDAEDVLDEIATADALQWRRTKEETSSRWRRVSGCQLLSRFNCSSGMFSKYEIARRVKDINLKLENLQKEREGLGLQAVPSGRQNNLLMESCPVPSERETTSSLGKDVFGREEEKEAIIKMLLSSDDKPETSSHGARKVVLIPIVGMGGIGKTTLAQMVYNDSRVQKDFSFKRWICVSDNFDVRRLITEIIGESQNRLSLEDLNNKLKERLRNEKFLIVLDDVWCEDQQEWKKIWVPLNQEGLGGKVIVTTRSEKVPNAVLPIQSNRLMPLSNEECWLIFDRRAFMDRDRENYHVLRDIGWKIVKRLKGIPLAVELVAGVLCNISDTNYWESLLESSIWPLDNESDIRPIIRLSYQHLPTPQKRCFASCALFPKDWLFDRWMLVRLWMAQGLVRPEGSRRMEDVANLYFNDLLQRSFFQIKAGPYYVMHELIHDLVESIAKGECFKFGENKLDKECGKVRHVSFEFISNVSSLQFEKLHTFLNVSSCVTSSKTMTSFICRMKSVRVLIIGIVDIFREEFPDVFGDLIHLRYLCMKGGMRLPKSVCRLYNLQTLEIDEHTELPEGMNQLVNLRHLILPWQSSVYFARISGIGRLTSLQELRTFEVRNVKGYKIGELQNMNQLRGELSIRGLENVGSREDAMQANLKAKVHLDSLELSWTVGAHDSGLDESVMDALEPSPKITQLLIQNNKGTKIPQWMQGQVMPISNLTSLRMESCNKWVNLPPVDQLYHLKHLSVYGLDSIKQVKWRFQCKEEGLGNMLFPSLETLEFGRLGEWEEWVVVPPGSSPATKIDDRGGDDNRNSSCDNGFPSLRVLRVLDCHKLRTFPSFLPVLTKGLVINESRILPKEHYTASGVTLFIANCMKLSSSLSSLPAHYLKAMESLTIHDRNDLSAFLGEDGLMLQRLQSLKELTIVRCRFVPSLPTYMHTLASLQTLMIRDCPRIETVLVDNLPPSLRRLFVIDCEDFQCLNTNQHSLSSLQELLIRDCPQMQTLRVCNLPLSLRKLVIKSCKGLRSLCNNCLQSLPAGLNILSFHEESVKFGGSLPPSLQKLEIDRYGGPPQPLPTHPHRLPFLQELYISGCPQIQALTGCTLPPSLQKLHIRSCEDLQSIPLNLNLLSSLQELLIHNCPRIHALPANSHFPSLRKLEINDCRGLRSLPSDMHLLSSLHELEISLCQQLNGMPDLGLPPSLKWLTIRGCPVLIERCREAVGPDWPKIAHVPHISLFPQADLSGEIFADIEEIGECTDQEGEDPISSYWRYLQELTI